MRDIELRRSLFAYAPARVSYAVHVPANGNLTLGLGARHHQRPVTFRVTVEPRAGESREVLYEIHSAPDLWLDRTIDLSQFAGSDVRLVLEASSDLPGALALWGEPTLRSGSAATNLEPILAGHTAAFPRRIRPLGDLSAIGSGVWWARIAPDGNHYVLSADRSGKGEIWTFDPAAGTPVRLANVTMYAEFPSWSPDGKALAYGVWDDAGKRYMWVTPLETEDGTRRVSLSNAWGAIYSPDGEWIVYGDCSCDEEQRGLVIVPVRGGEPRRLTERPAFPLAWSPDGEWIYYHLEGESPLWFGRVRAAGGPEEHLVSAYCCGHEDVGVSPDTRYLALGVPLPSPTGQTLRRLVVWSIATRETVLDEPLPAGITAFGWTSAGRILAVHDEPRTTIRTIATTGGEPITIGLEAGRDHAPAWSPDGRRIAFKAWAGNHFVPAVMNVDGSSRQTFGHAPVAQQGGMQIEWSPDARLIGYRSPVRGFLSIDVDSENRFGSQSMIVSLDMITGSGKTLSTWASSTPLFWGSQGENILSAASNGRIWESPAAGGPSRQIRQLPAGTYAYVHGTAWLGVQDTDLYLHDGDAEPELLLSGVHSSLFGLSPDGRTFVAVADNGEGSATDRLLIGRPGIGPIEVPLPGVPEPPLAWHPDGSRLFFRIHYSDTGRHGVVSLPVSGGRAEQVTPAAEPDVTTFSLSPDGARIVYDVYQPPRQTLVEIDLTDRLP